MPHAFDSAYSSAFSVDTGQGHGSWEQLLGFIDEARDIDRQDRSTAPTSCPNDHTALRAGPDGKLFCPWDGLVWPDDASAWGEFPGSY